MIKRRSVGIGFFISLLILNGYLLLRFLRNVFEGESFLELLLTLIATERDHVLAYTAFVVIIQGVLILIPLLVSSVLVLLGKELGRKIAIWASLLGILMTAYIAFVTPEEPWPFKGLIILTYCGIIWFFTRTRVKEQFKG
ncbi:hypothetical protein ACFL0T_08445 [Candidatus Omnitrophota bacterium]